jgi:hypothetical protein
MAPVDLTGTWVSVVTEEWRYRMMTPRKGMDFDGLPMTAAARTAAMAWDPAADEAAGLQCKGYGAPALMRMPGRARISWEDDATLKIEYDTGQQTRLLHFGGRPPAGAQPSWQGYSVAEWELVAPTIARGGFGRPGGARPVVAVLVARLREVRLRAALDQEDRRREQGRVDQAAGQATRSAARRSCHDRSKS